MAPHLAATTATIGLIDARTEAPGTLGTLLGTHPTVEAAFAAHAALQAQNTVFIPTKIVTLRAPLSAGCQVKPKHLLAEGERLN